MPDFKQTLTSTEAAAAAEKARPNWKVVPLVQADAERVQADASTPELSTILHKYFGGNAVRAAVPEGVASSELVAMEPINAPNTSFGRKVVLIQNGQITGEQG